MAVQTRQSSVQGRAISVTCRRMLILASRKAAYGKRSSFLKHRRRFKTYRTKYNISKATCGDTSLFNRRAQRTAQFCLCSHEAQCTMTAHRYDL